MKVGKEVTLAKIYSIILLLFLLSSCYSTHYTASYSVQNVTSASETKDVAMELINKLANKNDLLKDDKFNNTDTLGFFGMPYHYFKFWIEDHKELTYIVIDYHGSFHGIKGKSPYEDFLNNITDSIREKFILTSFGCEQETNGKGKGTGEVSCGSINDIK